MAIPFTDVKKTYECIKIVLKRWLEPFKFLRFSFLMWKSCNCFLVKYSSEAATIYHFFCCRSRMRPHDIASERPDVKAKESTTQFTVKQLWGQKFYDARESELFFVRKNYENEVLVHQIYFISDVISILNYSRSRVDRPIRILTVSISINYYRLSLFG